MENNPDDAIEDANVLEVIKMMGPVSVLAVTEGDTESYARLLVLFETAYPQTDYGLHVATRDVWEDRNAVMYDKNQLSFISGTEIDDWDLLRPVPIAQLYHGGSDTTIHFGSVHLKSGGTEANATTRGVEAQIISTYLQLLPSTDHIILAGDFNLDNDQEAAWQKLVTEGILFDTANRPGDWVANAEFKDLHSQNSQYSLSRRLDIILSNSKLRDTVGLESLESTYATLGNNGTHTMFEGITTGTGATTVQLAALAAAADHLPVFVDLVVVPEVPTTMAATTSEGASAITITWSPTISLDYMLESSQDLVNWDALPLSSFPSNTYTKATSEGERFWRIAANNSYSPL
jgi:endonuclease/exonuclease/phosphatase family metal-dependent hydrolase